jgi:hypothetical protein
MLIAVTGRRSGATHTLPVLYEREGQRLKVPVMWPERKLWWRNLGDQPAVRVLLAGRWQTGTAEVTQDSSGTIVTVLLSA